MLFKGIKAVKLSRPAYAPYLRPVGKPLTISPAFNQSLNPIRATALSG